MKKIYFHPAFRVAAIDADHMMAASPSGTGTEKAEGVSSDKETTIDQTTGESRVPEDNAKSFHLWED